MSDLVKVEDDEISKKDLAKAESNLILSRSLTPDLKIISNCQKDLIILKITNVIFPMLNDFLYNRNMRQNLIKHNQMNELANKQSAFFQGRQNENVTNLNF